VAWWAATRIMAEVGDLVQRARDGHTGQVLDRRTIRRSGGDVCGLHHARGDEERGFLGLGLKTGSYGLVIWASKSPRRFLGLGLKTTAMVYQWFGLKTTRTVFSGLASKPVVTISPSLTSKLAARVSRFKPQNRQLRFSDLGLKITATVF
jgi:hypothetical protein